VLALQSLTSRARDDSDKPETVTMTVSRSRRVDLGDHKSPDYFDFEVIRRFDTEME
jgi:hypothetical protein